MATGPVTGTSGGNDTPSRDARVRPPLTPPPEDEEGLSKPSGLQPSPHQGDGPDDLVTAIESWLYVGKGLAKKLRAKKSKSSEDRADGTTDSTVNLFIRLTNALGMGEATGSALELRNKVLDAAVRSSNNSLNGDGGPGAIADSQSTEPTVAKQRGTEWAMAVVEDVMFTDQSIGVSASPSIGLHDESGPVLMIQAALSSPNAVRDATSTTKTIDLVLKRFSPFPTEIARLSPGLISTAAAINHSAILSQLVAHTNPTSDHLSTALISAASSGAALAVPILFSNASGTPSIDSTVSAIRTALLAGHLPFARIAHRYLPSDKTAIGGEHVALAAKRGDLDMLEWCLDRCRSGGTWIFASDAETIRALDLAVSAPDSGAAWIDLAWKISKLNVLNGTDVAKLIERSKLQAAAASSNDPYIGFTNGDEKIGCFGLLFKRRKAKQKETFSKISAGTDSKSKRVSIFKRRKSVVDISVSVPKQETAVESQMQQPQSDNLVITGPVTNVDDVSYHSPVANREAVKVVELIQGPTLLSNLSDGDKGVDASADKVEVAASELKLLAGDGYPSVVKDARPLEDKLIKQPVIDDECRPELVATDPTALCTGSSAACLVAEVTLPAPTCPDGVSLDLGTHKEECEGIVPSASNSAEDNTVLEKVENSHGQVSGSTERIELPNVAIVDSIDTTEYHDAATNLRSPEVTVSPTNVDAVMETETHFKSSSRGASISSESVPSPITTVLSNFAKRSVDHPGKQKPTSPIMEGLITVSVRKEVEAIERRTANPPGLQPSLNSSASSSPPSLRQKSIAQHHGPNRMISSGSMRPETEGEKRASIPTSKAPLVPALNASSMSSGGEVTGTASTIIDGEDKIAQAKTHSSISDVLPVAVLARILEWLPSFDLFTFCSASRDLHSNRALYHAKQLANPRSKLSIAVALRILITSPPKHMQDGEAHAKRLFDALLSQFKPSYAIGSHAKPGDVQFRSARAAVIGAATRSLGSKQLDPLLELAANLPSSSSKDQDRLTPGWTITKLLSVGSTTAGMMSRLLVSCCARADKDAVSALLGAGANADYDVGEDDESSDTALAAATRAGAEECVDFLLDAGADPGRADSLALRSAAGSVKCGAEIVSRLLAAGANPASRDYEAIKTAAGRGQADQSRGSVLAVLINSVVGQIRARWEVRAAIRAAYDIASRSGNANGIRTLLTEKATWLWGQKLDTPSEVLRGALNAAISGKHTEVVREFALSEAWPHLIVGDEGKPMIDLATKSVLDSLATFTEGGLMMERTSSLDQFLSMNKSNPSISSSMASLKMNTRGANQGKTESLCEPRKSPEVDPCDEIEASGPDAAEAAELVEAMLSGAASLGRARYPTEFYGGEEAATKRTRIDVWEVLTASQELRLLRSLLLLQAAKLGHETVVDGIICVLQPNCSSVEVGGKALIAAVEGGHIKIVASLIAAGADFECFGGKAFKIAEERGHTTILQYLLNSRTSSEKQAAKRNELRAKRNTIIVL